jgi:hypothetical protein
VLGDSLDTLELLDLFLPMAISCLKDNESHESTTASTEQDLLYLLEPRPLHSQVWTLCDFMLQHVIDLMKLCEQCESLEVYMRMLFIQDDQNSQRKGYDANSYGGSDARPLP